MTPWGICATIGGMKANDRVRTVYGKIETVRMVTDTAVYTYENLLSWYHPTKIFKA